VLFSSKSDTKTTRKTLQTSKQSLKTRARKKIKGGF